MCSSKLHALSYIKLKSSNIYLLDNIKNIKIQKELLGEKRSSMCSPSKLHVK